jgi:hypothetical protein
MSALTSPSQATANAQHRSRPSHPRCHRRQSDGAGYPSTPEAVMPARRLL